MLVYWFNFIAIDVTNFLIRKKREWSTNSTDIEERKRPHVASSLDDLIVEANNGEMFKKALKSDDCVAIICNCI